MSAPVLESALRVLIAHRHTRTPLRAATRELIRVDIELLRIARGRS